MNGWTDVADSKTVRMAAEIVRGIYGSGVFRDAYFDMAMRLDNLADLLEEQEANVMTADEFAACQEASIRAQFGGDDA